MTTDNPAIVRECDHQDGEDCGESIEEIFTTDLLKLSVYCMPILFILLLMNEDIVEGSTFALIIWWIAAAIGRCLMAVNFALNYVAIFTTDLAFN